MENRIKEQQLGLFAVEMVHDLRDAAIAEQAHADDEPHHVPVGETNYYL